MNGNHTAIYASSIPVTRNAGLMEGLIWVSLLALLVKRRIRFSIQRLMGVDISSFMVAKNTQSWFYPLMEPILHDAYFELKNLKFGSELPVKI